jgi:hypothetical protein
MNGEPLVSDLFQMTLWPGMGHATSQNASAGTLLSRNCGASATSACPTRDAYKYLGAAPDSWDWEIGFARDVTQFKSNRF